MRLRRDCANFLPSQGPCITHSGPEGTWTVPAGACRLSLIGIGGCPEECGNYAKA